MSEAVLEMGWKRWSIAVAGTVLQLCLGTVYAWSSMQGQLVKLLGWSNARVMGTFSIAIACLGLSAAWGGINLKKIGPRKLATIGAVLFGAGYLLAGLAIAYKSQWLLYAGYGVIGGIGLGLCYVTPVATVAKWFPDKKGLVTGMVVMGFGLGALLMSKVLMPILSAATQTPQLPSGNYPLIFGLLGLLFWIVTVPLARMMRNPQASETPAASQPRAAVPPTTSQLGAAPQPQIQAELSPTSALFSGRFGLMWLAFFCNIAAGIAVISLQSPLMHDLCGRANPSLSETTLVSLGAWLVAVSSLFNGLGRIFWGGFSDRFGRVNTFRLMIATGIVAFLMLTQVSSPWVFGGLICYILLCYGGGFGTMPSFVLDVFGAKLMPVVYGVILTAWSAGAVVGPMVFASIKDAYKTQLDVASRYCFLTAGGFLAVGLVATLLIRPKRERAA